MAVLLGFFILRDLRNDTSIAAPEENAAPAEEMTTETTADPLVPVETTVAPVALTAFKVQVANASGVSGSAGLLTTDLQGKGYIVQPAINKSEVTPRQTARHLFRWCSVLFRSSNRSVIAQVAQNEEPQQHGQNGNGN
ncbi:MAG: LytR family transcriptional regulator [Actinobacteria bacterium]|nr:LytR family transcriptional regulator [Actinomycetota bacterium]